jgi:hypothetical protein
LGKLAREENFFKNVKLNTINIKIATESNLNDSRSSEIRSLLLVGLFNESLSVKIENLIGRISLKYQFKLNSYKNCKRNSST